jgi:hypothetical protein
VLIRARADARANEIIRLSTSGAVLQYRAIERWDGKLPVMQGGDKTPLLTFDVGRFAGTDEAREKKLRQMLEEEELKGKASRQRASQDKPSEAAPAPPPPAPTPPPAPSAAPATQATRGGRQKPRLGSACVRPRAAAALPPSPALSA